MKKYFAVTSYVEVEEDSVESIIKEVGDAEGVDSIEGALMESFEPKNGPRGTELVRMDCEQVEKPKSLSGQVGIEHKNAPIKALQPVLGTFMCRWPNGDLSIVTACSQEEAVVRLDEVGNADWAEVQPVESFMVHLALTDAGALVVENFGDDCCSEIVKSAYPLLEKSTRNRPNSPRDEGKVREAVRMERTRLAKKHQPPDAATEAGKKLQRLMDTPAARANQHVNSFARKVLEKHPTKGTKH